MRMIKTPGATRPLATKVSMPSLSASPRGRCVLRAASAIHPTLEGDRTESYSDGREQRLLAHVRANVPMGSAAAVLQGIDTYGWSNDWLMNVGDVKGSILDSALAQAVSAGSTTFLEIGTYCGYSGIRIASQLPANTKLYSIEVNQEFAEVAQAMIKHAGLADRAEVIVGDVPTAIKILRSKGVDTIGFAFIDHWKQLYVRDFSLLRTEGLLKKGGIVVADNLLYPGAPDYIKLMEDSPEQYHFVKHRSTFAYSEKQDIVGVSVMLQ